MICSRCNCPIKGRADTGADDKPRHPAGRCPDIAQQLKQGLRAQGSELTSADVGKSFGEAWGPITTHDVGKRVWRRSYGLVLEGADQRDARKQASKETP